MSSASIQQLMQIALRFRAQRDWEQFHTPKDLAADLVVEASELLEHMLWRRDETLAQHIAQRKPQIADELGDVLHVLVLLAHDLQIDLGKAFKQKMKKNAAKYPVHKSRGSPRKYTEL
jgi:NTP pyrophosphatase (non-canonical NTP hydrolase)